MKKQFSLLLLCFILFSTLIPTDFSAVSAHDANVISSDNQWYLSEIGLPAVSENTSSVSDNAVTIAVIDTGLLLSHPALKDSLWTNTAEADGTPGIDDDGNGYIDDIHGYNFRSNNGDVTDTDGHGTHVAGIIAMKATASDPSTGIFPDARIMVIKAGNTTNGFSSANLIKSIRYALQNGADVINLSLGTTYCSEEMQTVLAGASQKALVVAAAGNASTHTRESTSDSGENMYPAALPEVIGVMSFDQGYGLSWFSNWDIQPGTDRDYELIAPGNDIYSTTLKNNYKTESGTSMSAPMVSAACGILIREWKNYALDKAPYSPGIIRESLQNGAGSFITHVDSSGKTLLFPRLNIRDSLSYLRKHFFTSAGNPSVSDNDAGQSGGSVSGNDSGQSGGSVSGNNSGQPDGSVSENNSGTQDPASGEQPHTVSDSPAGGSNPSGSHRDVTDRYVQTLIRSVQTSKPTVQKKKLFHIKNGRSDLTGQPCRIRKWNRTRLTFRLKNSSQDGWYLFRSTSKNGKYRLVFSTISNKLVLKKTGRTYYYYVKAYRIINGKRYVSKRSRKITI